MEENIKRAIAQAAQIVAKGSTQSHTPSAPQNYLRDKRKRDRVEKKILASLAEGHQAHPEPMLATNHDYVSRVSGISSMDLTSLHLAWITAYSCRGCIWSLRRIPRAERREPS